MTIRTWNPSEGDACQGDICLFRVPADLKIAEADEIMPQAGRLVLQEGEVTGHYHVVKLPAPVMFRDDAAARAAEAKAGIVPVSARLFRDDNAADDLVRRGELTRSDLAIGFLVVEGGEVTVSHEEHDAVRVPPGRYYVGRQVESAGAEERLVAD